MSRTHLPMLGFCVLALQCYGGRLAHAQLDAADVVAGLRQREAAVRNATVHVKLEKLQRVGIKPTAALVPLKFVFDVTWDASGRIRYAVVGQRPGKQPNGEAFVTDYTEDLAFDGETTSSVRRNNDATRHAEKHPGREPSWPVDPREFDTHWYGEPVSSFLSEGRISVIGYESQGERELLVCESERHPDDGFKYRVLHRFHIDVDRGFLVVAKQGYSRPADSEGWIIFGSARCEGHVELEPGIWMPTRSRKEHHVGATAGEPRLWSKLEAEMSGWRINRELSDDTFTLAFKQGMHVTDHAVGKRYVTSTIDDAHLDAQAARAEQLAMEFQDMASNEEIRDRLSQGRGGRAWPYFFFAGIALLVIGAAYAGRGWLAKRRT